MTNKKRERDGEGENERRHRSPISVIKWDIVAGPKAMKRIIKEYCKQLYAHKFDNLEEVNQFLKNHKLPRHIQDETNNWNSPTTIKEVEFIIKNFWKTNMQNQMVSLKKSTKPLNMN